MAALERPGRRGGVWEEDRRDKEERGLGLCSARDGQMARGGGDAGEVMAVQVWDVQAGKEVSRPGWPARLGRG